MWALDACTGADWCQGERDVFLHPFHGRDNQQWFFRWRAHKKQVRHTVVACLNRPSGLSYYERWNAKNNESAVRRENSRFIGEYLFRVLVGRMGTRDCPRSARAGERTRRVNQGRDILSSQISGTGGRSADLLHYNTHIYTVQDRGGS